MSVCANLTQNTQVEVKCNCLRAEGMIAIAEALKVNSTVTKIDVSDNEIGGFEVGHTSCPVGFYQFKSTPEGPAALAEALKVNTTVQWVHVSQNSLGPEGGTALASALQTNTSITTVSQKSLCFRRLDWKF